MMGKEPSQHEIVTILGFHGSRPEVIQFYLKEFFECFFSPLWSKYVRMIGCYAVLHSLLLIMLLVLVLYFAQSYCAIYIIICIVLYFQS